MDFVYVCVCVRVWQIWSICSLRSWHFAFLTFAFFCHFCFRSLTHSPHLPLSLSLYRVSPLSQHGVLITLSWSLQLTDSNLCAAVITLSGSGAARQDSNKLVGRRRHSVRFLLSTLSHSLALFRGRKNNHVLYTDIYMFILFLLLLLSC